MVTLSVAQLAALSQLGESLHRMEATAAEKAAKAARRAERWARFEGTVREGLKYSRGCVRRLRKVKGEGGAVPEWKLRRIPEPRRERRFGE